MRTEDHKITDFLSSYDTAIVERALQLRALVLKQLPDITEQLDLSAKMIAYAYSQTYKDLICVIIPSKKGLKLGFNRGTELPDPDQLLEGTGKISRYVQVRTPDDITAPALKALLKAALQVWKKR